jgi:hypothetical protein
LLAAAIYFKATTNTNQAEKKGHMQKDKDNFRLLDIAIRNIGRS